MITFLINAYGLQPKAL